ncbi:unnamed protein product [Euphydryas editha]|uniref:Uncharacterized protein n=1 Tax=Euphydryas editha TaxID=104508 RepID=A0AAU9TKV8_EUPED|nr:unnamed protein product [Euphydryas editha]
MNTSIENLQKNMEELSSMVSCRMGDFEKNLSLSSANPTVKSLAADFHAFKTLVWKTLGLLKSQIELLAQGMDRLETQSRKKLLLFHGIGEDKDEDVHKKILTVLSNEMRIPGISGDHLSSCHRLGSKKDSARPILVRFSNVHLRSKAWKAKTNSKGTKITITEFLTKCRQDIFIAARNYFGMKKCWTADGVIVILLPDKSRIKVTTMLELKQIISQNPKSEQSSGNK